jgi:hypothetical protein
MFVVERILEDNNKILIKANNLVQKREGFTFSEIYHNLFCIYVRVVHVDSMYEYSTRVQSPSLHWKTGGSENNERS